MSNTTNGHVAYISKNVKNSYSFSLFCMISILYLIGYVEDHFVMNIIEIFSISNLIDCMPDILQVTLVRINNSIAIGNQLHSALNFL